MKELNLELGVYKLKAMETKKKEGMLSNLVEQYFLHGMTKNKEKLEAA